MNREILRRGSVKALLAVSMLIGVAFIAGAPSVQAQYRNDPYYGYDIYRIAQDQGYGDGLEEGAKDGRERDRYKPEDSGRYRDASRGYRSEYGNKEAYKQAYREGFRRGYDQGFRQYTYGGNNDPYYRNDPYGRNDPYRRTGEYGYGRYDIYQVAQDQGYRDGYQRGAEDGRDGDRHNPEGTSQYRDGDRGYRSEYGNREEYRRIYRDAFRRGYDEGYRREGRGGYNRGNTGDRARRIADILGTILGRP